MQELMVLSGNPKRRRKHRKARRRAHRRGKRRGMTPLQLQYFGGGRKNPRRRRSGGKARRRGRRRHAVSRGRGFAGRFLRTGTGSVSHPFSMVGPALTGAIGAVAVNSVIGRIGSYIPGNLMSGNVSFVTRGAIAIGLGMIAARIPGVGSGVAAKMAEGSLTVTLHEMIVALAAQAGIGLSGMGYYLPGRQGPSPSASGNPAMLAGVGKYVTGPGSPSGSVVPMRRASGGFGSVGIWPTQRRTSFGF